MEKHDNWKENTYGQIFQTTGGDEPAMELPKSQKHRHQVPKIFSWFSFLSQPLCLWFASLPRPLSIFWPQAKKWFVTVLWWHFSLFPLHTALWTETTKGLANNRHQISQQNIFFTLKKGSDSWRQRFLRILILPDSHLEFESCSKMFYCKCTPVQTACQEGEEVPWDP